MPVLQSHILKLPTENKNATDGEVFTRRFAYAGNVIDGRTLSNEDIKRIYTDTTQYNSDSGYVVKMKLGHSQEGDIFVPGEQKLSGFLTELELRDETLRKDKRLSLWGKFHMYSDIASDIKQGMYPEQSIGLFPSPIMDSKGNVLESPLDHIALLGSERAGLPEQLSAFNKIIKGLSNLIFKKEAVKNMDNNLKSETIGVIDQATRLLVGLGQKLGLEDTTDPGKKEPEKQPDSTDPGNLATDKKVIPSSEVTKKFNELVASGNLSPDRRDKFDELVELSGDLEKSVSFFAKEQAKTPPKGDTKAGSDRNEIDLVKEIAAANKRFEQLGYDDEKIKSRIAEMEEEIKNGTYIG